MPLSSARISRQNTMSLHSAPSRSRRICLLATAVAFAHLPFWLLSQAYAIERAQISTDLLLATAVLAWHRTLGILLLTSFWLIDLLVSQSATYHFLSPAAFLDSARFLGDLQLSSLISLGAALVLIVFVLCGWIVLLLSKQRKPEWLMTAAALGLFAILDLINGSSRYAQTDHRALPLNVAGSPSLTLARQVDSSRQYKSPIAIPARDSIADAVGIVDWAKEHPNVGVWLVVVESMGWPRDTALRRRLSGQMYEASKSGRYQIDERQMPFKGSTTYGELRALCRVAGSYAHLSDQQASSCLPAQLARQGWTTTGLHGFSGHMFDRTEWWPKIGFQQTLFLDGLSGELPLCGGAFRGICDKDLLRSSSQRFSSPRQFVYTLTLNTHLPLDPVAVPPDWQSACKQAGSEGAACELLVLQAELLSTVAALASEVPEPRPLVVIIGDHAPPFLNAKARGAFDPTTVPAFVLRPQ